MAETYRELMQVVGMTLFAVQAGRDAAATVEQAVHKELEALIDKNLIVAVKTSSAGAFTAVDRPSPRRATLNGDLMRLRFQVGPADTIGASDCTCNL